MRIALAAVFVQAVIERFKAYAEQLGGLALASMAMLERGYDDFPLDCLQRRAHGELQQWTTADGRLAGVGSAIRALIEHHVGVRHDKGALHGVLQFPDITRPIVPDEIF